MVYFLPPWWTYLFLLSKPPTFPFTILNHAVVFSSWCLQSHCFSINLLHQNAIMKGDFSTKCWWQNPSTIQNNPSPKGLSYWLPQPLFPSRVTLRLDTLRLVTLLLTRFIYLCLPYSDWISEIFSAAREHQSTIMSLSKILWLNLDVCPLNQTLLYRLTSSFPADFS